MCYLCVEEENPLDPRKEEDYPLWIEEQRQAGKRYVHSAFRELRFKVGIPTLGDLVYEVWQENLKMQSRDASQINYTMPRVRKFNA